MKTHLEHMATHHHELEIACHDMEKAAETLESMVGECTAEHSMECAMYNLLEEMVDCVAALSKSQVATSKALHEHLMQVHKPV